MERPREILELLVRGESEIEAEDGHDLETCSEIADELLDGYDS